MSLSSSSENLPNDQANESMLCAKIYVGGWVKWHRGWRCLPSSLKNLATTTPGPVDMVKGENLLLQVVLWPLPASGTILKVLQSVGYLCQQRFTHWPSSSQAPLRFLLYWASVLTLRHLNKHTFSHSARFNCWNDPVFLQNTWLGKLSFQKGSLFVPATTWR